MKKTFGRIVALLLTAVMLLGLAACGNSAEPSARKMTAHRTGHGRVPRVYAMLGIV